MRYDGASDNGGREEVVEESGEISQLRNQVAALAREKGQLLSRLREDGKSEELVRENEALKTQVYPVHCLSVRETGIPCTLPLSEGDRYTMYTASQ